MEGLLKNDDRHGRHLISFAERSSHLADTLPLRMTTFTEKSMNTDRAALAGMAACVLLAGCEIPTALPIAVQWWQIPLEETTLGVDGLLPDGVVVKGSDFEVSVDPVATSKTLGDLCGNVCDVVNNQVVMIPAFGGLLASSQSLPDDVVSATISGGSIEVEIANGFTFDPLLGGGTITVDLTNGVGGVSLGQITLDGTTDVMAPGSTVTRTLTLVSGTLDGQLATTTTVNIVGGQEALVQVSDALSVVARANAIRVSEVVVDVPSQAITFDPVDIGVKDIDSDVTDKIGQGTITLKVNNPFAASFSGNVVIGPTSKPFVIAGSGPSTVQLAYSSDELRLFLGQPGITFSGSGTATGVAVTITPLQELTIEATLDVTIEIGG